MFKRGGGGGGGFCNQESVMQSVQSRLMENPDSHRHFVLEELNKCDSYKKEPQTDPGTQRHPQPATNLQTQQQTATDCIIHQNMNV